MANLLPIASGKGGVGKSSISVNLAVTLAKLDKKVVLADLDLGGANLHTLLGLRNNHAGLGNFIYKQTSDISELLQETSVPNLQFIAGDCLYPGTANITAGTKNRILKALSKLDADYVILDLGAGTTYNTLDFFLSTYNSILVTTPQLTSILNAYSFLKAAAFRFFMRQFKTKSEERMLMDKYIRESTSGADMSFTEMVDTVVKYFPDTGKTARDQLARYRPQVIVNIGETSQDLEMAKRLRSLVQKKLGIQMDFVGFLPKDEGVNYAIALRSPLAVTNPDCQFVMGITKSVERIFQHTYEYNELHIFESDENSEDLEVLSKEFEEAGE